MFTITQNPNCHNERKITYKSLKFSGGEVQVKLDFIVKDSNFAEIFAHITSADQILELVMLVDALHNAGFTNLSLICPYLPYARQDRVMNAGEALSIKAFANILNSLNFTKVTVWDVHSDVSLAVIDRVVNVGPETFVQLIQGQTVHPGLTNMVLVAPDAGAIKKVLKVAQGFKLPMVRADKIRNTHDGKITDTIVYSEHIGDKDFLIVDDILDKGRTFIELAKVLKPLTNGKIYLYITHGIFAGGFDTFRENIDHIFCALPFPNVDLSDPIITKLI